MKTATKRAPRMRESFTPEQKKKLESQRVAHNASAAKALANARTPVKANGNGDWPKPGSKNALLFDTAVKAGEKGISWEALAKKVGWARVNWTLKDICKKLHAKLTETDDGRVIVTPRR